MLTVANLSEKLKQMGELIQVSRNDERVEIETLHWNGDYLVFEYYQSFDWEEVVKLSQSKSLSLTEALEDLLCDLKLWGENSDENSESDFIDICTNAIPNLKQVLEHPQSKREFYSEIVNFAEGESNKQFFFI